MSRPPLFACAGLLLVFASTLPAGRGACFFSIELQGQFLMQSAVSLTSGAGPGGLASASATAAAVRYSQVNITAEAIPVWGHCHRRLGHNVILEDSSGARACVRCFQLRLRSPNILQVLTEGLDKCYITEEAARAACPGPVSASATVPSTRRAPQEIVLYKTRDHKGDLVREQYCPISGRFVFSSRGGLGMSSSGRGARGGQRDCPNDATSDLETCPSGAQLNIRYRNCNFPDFDVTYACLGHWEASNGQQYLALLNRAVDSFPRYPRYRCALISEDAVSGAVAMAFASDSTCHSDLRNATWGAETLTLTPWAARPWPDAVEGASCRFPPWAQGHWQHLQVDGGSLVYRNHSNFKTYTMRCVGGTTAPQAERFLVFARTQCGEQMYSCVWLKNRSANVLEFQMGLGTQSDPNPALCDDANFQPKTWITQGRLRRARETPCPVIGEYTGVIPDAEGLCARLASDCSSPETMFYAVSECLQAEVYEEREYRCLGQWEEGGLTYTYTQRRDVDSYECFVGSIVSGDEIYIKEAGEHCTRDTDPLHQGMKLTRRGPCVGSSAPGLLLPRRPTSTWQGKHPPVEPTKPWKPVTAPPHGSGDGAVATATWCTATGPWVVVVAALTAVGTL